MPRLGHKSTAGSGLNHADHSLPKARSMSGKNTMVWRATVRSMAGRRCHSPTGGAALR